tara:strand:+ start:242 stop:718 length:477 start_codon:yes stop_codon:yes gene_type:complete
MPSLGEAGSVIEVGDGDISVDLAMLDNTVQGQLQQANSSQDMPAKLSIVDRIKSIQSVNAKDWGIRKGCIASSRIRKIKFLDDQTAMLTLRGKKKAILRLGSACPGIKRNGYARINDGIQLCKRFDSFSVLGGSFSCRVASIDPYVELADPPSLATYD